LRVLIGDSQSVFIELITELVTEVVDKECEVTIHNSDNSQTILKLAEENRIDLAVLFLNNILFPSGNLPSDDRMTRVMRLVWDIKMEYNIPIIGVCGLPEYADYSRIAGVDFFFKAPFKNEQFMDAARICLNIVDGGD